MKEAAELRDPTEHYHAQPLEVSSQQDTNVQQGWEQLQEFLTIYTRPFSLCTHLTD